MAASSRMRRVALISMLPVMAAACEQLLGVPNDPEDVASKVGRVCSCSDLSAQGDSFVEACSAGLDALSDADLISVAEAGCTRCPDGADELSLLRGCYGRISGAAPEKQACSAKEACETFACCARKVEAVISQNGVTATHDDTCCEVDETCEGCASIVARTDLAATNPNLVACVEGLDLFIEAMSCGCAAHRDAPIGSRPCGPSCGSVSCNLESLECRNCLIATYGGECPQMAACGQDRDRPIQAQGSP